MKTRVAVTLLIVLGIVIGNLFYLVNTEYFSNTLKGILQGVVGSKSGIEWSFSRINTKLWPPAIVIKEPRLRVMEKRNILKLPKDTLIESEKISIEFKPFQLFTGKIYLNAIRFEKSNVFVEYDDPVTGEQESKTKNKNILTNDLFLSSLFNIDIGGHLKFRIYGLHFNETNIRFKHKGAGIELFSPGISFSAQRSTTGIRLYADGKSLEINTAEKEELLKQVNVSVELNPSEVNIGALSFQRDEITAHVHGKLEGSILKKESLKSDISYIVKGPVYELATFLGVEGKTSGEFKAEGELKGNLRDYQLTSVLELEKPVYLGKKFARAGGRAKIRPGVLEIDEIEFDYEDGGKLKLANARLPFKLFSKKKDVFGNDPGQDDPVTSDEVKMRASFNKVDFRKLMGEWILDVYPLHFNIDGEMNVSWKGGVEDWKIDVLGNLVVSRFELDNQSPEKKKQRNVILSIPEMIIAPQISVDEEGLVFDGSRASVGKTRIGVTGKYAFGEGYDFRFSSDDFDLSDVGTINGIEIRGRGRLDTTLKGPSMNAWIDFGAENIKDAQYLGLKFGTLTGHILLEENRSLLHFRKVQARKSTENPYVVDGTIGLGNEEFIQMDARLPKMLVKDLSDIFSNLTADLWWYPRDLTGDIEGSIRISGLPEMDKLIAIGRIKAKNLEYMGERFKEADLVGGYREGTYFGEEAVFTKKNGKITGSLSYDKNSYLDYGLMSEGLSLKEIDLFTSWGVPLDGRIELQAEGKGTIGKIQQRASLKIDNVVIANKEFKGINADFSSDGNVFEMNGNAFENELAGKIRYYFQNGSTSTIQAKASDFSLLPALLLLNPDNINSPLFGGSVTGSLDLGFPTGKLHELDGKIVMERISVYKDVFDLKNVSPLNIQFDRGNWGVKNFLVTGNSSELVFNSNITGNGRFLNYSLDGHVNMRFMELFTPVIEEIRGIADVSARVDGTISKPAITGAAKFNGLDLKITGLEQSFENVTGNAVFGQSRLMFEKMRAKLGGGDISAGGSMDFYLHRFPVLDLFGEIKNSKIKVFPFQYVVAGGDIFVTGDRFPYLAAGSIKIEKGLVKQNFDVQAGQSGSRVGKYMPPSMDGKKNVVDLDIDVTTSGDIWVKNDLLDAEFKGNGKLVNTLSAPRLLGRMELVGGKILFKDYDFKINDALVKFVSRTDYLPDFSLSAQTEISNYKINLFVNGSGYKYKIDLASNPPLAQGELVSLLTLGATGTDIKKIKGDDQLYYSSSEVGALLLDQLKINKDIQKKFGFKISLDQSITSGTKNIFSNRPDNTDRAAPKVIVKRKISDKIDAAVGSTVGIGENKQQEFNLEYHLNNNCSLIGVYEDKTGFEEENKTSVGADLRFKWGFN